MASTVSPSSIDKRVVQQLAELLRNNGHRIIHGDSKVCLTSESLNTLNRQFQLERLNVRNNDFDQSSRNESARLTTTNRSKYFEDLLFLYNFLQKISAVKIIHNSFTLQGDVGLNLFQNIVYLEIKKISPQIIRGLLELRDRLETLICSQSLTRIEDLIGDCGGDVAPRRSWTRLKILFLDHNTIEHIDSSLKLLPALESLDLSHNRLRDCSKILDNVPHLKHLNLSSNHLRDIPTWSPVNDPCRLITLKIRQNSLLNIKTIQLMKSIEELDISDNFITEIPEEIRELTNIKRLFFARNPFTYANHYRQTVLLHLPFVCGTLERELFIDNRPINSKEKQMIQRNRSRPSINSSGFPFYSSSSSPTTTSESTVESEPVSVTSNGNVVQRRRPRSRPRKDRLRPLSPDDMPNENATSGSEAEVIHRPRLRRVIETNQEVDDSPSIQTRNSGQDQVASLKSFTNNSSRKFPNEITQHSKRKVSPRNRRTDQQSKILIEVVDDPHILSDATPIPDSPNSEREISFTQKTPLPLLQPRSSLLPDDHLVGDCIQTTFFAIDQTSKNNAEIRYLTLELDPMYFIEKASESADSVQKFKYSTIKLKPTDENRPGIVELTFEKQKNQFERRVYQFDTIHDLKAFVEEIERHLQPSTPIQLEPISPSMIECRKCGKNFPLLNVTRNGFGNDSTSSICMNCQSITALPPALLTSALNSAITTTTHLLTDDTQLDDRLHLHVYTEHFTHENEEISFHFRSLIVRSTSAEHFAAETIFTSYGIYIFEHRSFERQTNIEDEYILVGKDLLTNVLMLDVGYKSQSLTIELQSAAFTFLLADKKKTEKIYADCLRLLSPIVEKGEGALQKISKVSSDVYRQKLFNIIRSECQIADPTDEMIEFYSIMIRMDQTGKSQVIGLLLLNNWILMIEDDYEVIGNSRHVRLPASRQANSHLKCDLMHLERVINANNTKNLFIFDFVDESETIQFRWRLESLTNESKEDFLCQVRQTYEKLMGISMPEEFAIL